MIGFLMPAQSWAGSRGVDLAFFDATTGTRSIASLRLAELLEQDIRELSVDPKLGNLFPWSEEDLKLKILKPAEAGITFDRLLNTKEGKKIPALFEKLKTQDGLIVFFHDEANGYARFKLYNWDGTEVLLLRVPLEGKKSPMPASLLSDHRRGALAAIGASVRWSP